MEPIELDIIKQGETSFTATFYRSKKGLQIEVHAHPDVEDFIASLGTGELQEVRTIGRYWEPLDPNQRLQVYNLTTNPGNLMAEDGTIFNLNGVGRPLMDDEGAMAMDYRGTPVHVVNMSFLRLAGISKGGVSFSVNGVYSTDEVHAIRDKVGAAYKRFYQGYVKPLKVSVIVSTQEIQTR